MTTCGSSIIFLPKFFFLKNDFLYELDLPELESAIRKFRKRIVFEIWTFKDEGILDFSKKGHDLKSEIATKLEALQ